MLDITTALLLFLPLFLVVNLLAALPGRRDLREVVKVGLRHTGLGAAVLIGVCIACHFLFGWLLSRPPLW